MKFLLFILISYLTYLSGFVLNVNKHYTILAGDILNLNNNINYNPSVFKTVHTFNNNNSVCYNYNKNNVKYLLKDKYNYLISFELYKYKCLIILRSNPINYTNTELNIDIRHKQNFRINNTFYNLKHYKKIDNIIYKYIYQNVIKKKDTEYQQSVELFKFFNKY
jgi:hypothetical protein